jgi:hypothetical protein
MSAEVAVEQDMPTILKNARGMWLILEAADLRGLPMPYDADATDHSGIRLALHAVDELNTWAEAMDAEPTSAPFGLTTHWRAAGELHEVPLTVYVVDAS